MAKLERVYALGSMDVLSIIHGNLHMIQYSNVSWVQVETLIWLQKFRGPQKH